MKKLLIINNNLHSGGIQRSLVNFLKCNCELFDITLLLFYNGGEYRPLVPENIRVIEAPPALRILCISQSEAKGYGKPTLIWRSFMALASKLFRNYLPLRFTVSFMKKLSGFDYAISFMQSENPSLLYGGANEAVLFRCRDAVKIGFIHCDFASYGGNTPYIRKLYSRFDRIAACSVGSAKQFVKCNPNLADRTYAVTNFNDYENIKRLSEQDSVIYSANVLTVVTVARLSSEKGIERSLAAVSECVRLGLPVRYYIIGSGPLEASLKAQASELGLDGTVKFTGNLDNPYRYMKNADLFLLTSYHESAPMVFNEATFLGVPIFATETLASEDMIVENNAGFVCANEQAAITERLVSVCSDIPALRRFKQSLAGRKTGNKISHMQLDALLDGRHTEVF